MIEIPRSSFEDKGQISCGCGRKGRNLRDITNQKFGALTAIKLIERKNDTTRWLFVCDCGNNRKMSLRHITKYQRDGIRINCGDRNSHPEKYLEYPATPNPYPQGAGELLIKYLYLTELPYPRIDSAVEDEKRDRLIRTAWIITYRRSQGEEISELRENRMICKALRYCSITVFWRRKLETQGGLMYDVDNVKRQNIGSAMTNITSPDYPVIETQGINFMATDILPPTKRLSFRRC